MHISNTNYIAHLRIQPILYHREGHGTRRPKSTVALKISADSRIVAILVMCRIYLKWAGVFYDTIFLAWRPVIQDARDKYDLGRHNSRAYGPRESVLLQL